MHPTQNSRATQSTIPQLHTQEKLNFTHRQPTQLTRKFFHANLNLTSSTSLKRIEKLQPTGIIPTLSRRLDSVDTKIEKKSHQNNSRDSKLSRETIKKPENYWMSTKLKEKDKLFSSDKIQVKNKKNQGEWIKPKNFNNKRKDSSIGSGENQAFQHKNHLDGNEFQVTENHDILCHFDSLKNEKTQPNKCLIPHSPYLRSEPKYLINDDDDFIKPEDINEFRKIQLQQQPKTKLQSQQASISLIKQDLTQGSQPTASQTQIKSKVQIKNESLQKPKVMNDGKRTSIRDNDPFNKIDSVMLYGSPQPQKRLSQSKPSRLSHLLCSSPQRVSRDKRYSKFKTAVIDNEKKRKLQLQRMSLTLGHQNKGTTNNNSIQVSPFIISPQQHKQYPSTKSLQLSQLPPSHFSFTSHHSYVKKYQQLTSSPMIFQQSLRDLRQVEEDEEHEYFKYEKNLKKKMYYANKKQLKQEMIVRQDGGEGDREGKKRRVSYNRFVEEIKKKTTKNNNELYANEINSESKCKKQQDVENIQIKLTSTDLITINSIPQTIVQSHHQSSLLSDPTKLSSQSSKHEINNRNQLTLNKALIQHSQFSGKNPQTKIKSDKHEQEMKCIQNIQAPKPDQKIRGLMFTKKTKLEKMKHKLQLIREIQDQLSSQNISINTSFTERRNSHLAKFLNQNNQIL